MPFDPNKPFEVVPDASLVGRIEGSSFDPTKPFDVVQPTKKKEAKGTGQFTAESQPFAAFAKGGLESITAGLGGAAAEKITGTTQFDPNSPEFQNPYTFFAGEVIGGLVPLGKIVKGANIVKAGAKELSGEALKALRKSQQKRLVGEGARIGGIFGGGGGLATAIRGKEDIEDLTLGQAVESIVKGGAIGATVGAAIPYASQAVSRLGNLRATVDDRIADITKVSTAKGAFVDKFNQGSYSTVIPDIASKFKEGTGHAGLQEATNGLLKESIDLVGNVVKGADPKSALFDQPTMLSRIHQRASLEIPSEDARNRSISAALRDYSDVNPLNLAEYTGDIGKKLTALYSSPDKGRFSDRIHALEAVRDTFSDSVKTILDQEGVDPRIWSRYGLVRELGDRISDNYGDELAKLRQVRGEGISGGRGEAEPSLIQKIPGIGVLTRATKRAAQILKGGEPERLDNQINKMFRDVKPEVHFTDAQRKSVIQDAINRREENRLKGVVESEQSRLAQERQELLAREGASAEDLREGGAAAITLSQMEKDFQSSVEAQGLNRALMEIFPGVAKSERAVIERELRSAGPEETRDIMSQLLNEDFQIGERGAMTRISKEFDKVLRDIRKRQSSESLNLFPD